tara:strand:- start:21 stop:326 length:306 start_codon:yes stop_codon:yes gene_type:complete
MNNNGNHDIDIIEQLKADRKKRIQDLVERITEANPEAMLADGLNDALAGIDVHGRAIYFVEGIIGILMERDGMTEEEAVEFFDYNIAYTEVGDYTPIYMNQ